MGYVVGFIIAFAPAALAIVVAASLSRRSVEEWQLLAWVPPVPLVGWWIYFAIAALRDPTSHNLWPLELIFWAGVSAVLFMVFLVGRKVSASGRRQSPWKH